MSNGTEQDQSEQVDDGGATPAAGAHPDPVWPVWGDTPLEPALDPDAEASDTAERAHDDTTEGVAEAEPVAQPDDAIERDDEAEPVAEAEPDAVQESAAVAEPEADLEAEPETEPVPAPVAETTVAVVASAPPTEPTIEPTPEPAGPESQDPAEGVTEVLPPVAADAPEPKAAAPVVQRTSAFAPAAPTRPTRPTLPAEVPAAAAPAPAPTVVAPPVAARVAAPPPVPTQAFAPVTPAAAAASSTIQAGPVPMKEREPSPFDVFTPEDGRRRWPRRLAIVGGIVLVLCAAYVGAAFATADTVPRGASVAGVDIGGLSSADAVARLDKELASQTTQPIAVVAQGSQATLDPSKAGLSFDAQATVDALTGMDLSKPRLLWDHVAGVGAQRAVTAVDTKKLQASVDGLSTALTLAPVDGTIVYVGSTAQSTDAADGWALDAPASAKLIADDWLVAPRPLTLPTSTVAPAITQEATDAALAEASKVTSAPVSVEVDGQVALLDAATLAANTSFVPTDGKLAMQMNPDGLAAAVLAKLPTLLTKSADAHFQFVNDAPVIVPGTAGTNLDPKAVAAAVSKAAVSDKRTASAKLVKADPTQSTAALEALGVKEIVSEFDTPLTSEPRRTVNITNGASKISGTLIKPGETFSLTDALGPLDAAHGFVEAGAIVSGEHTDAWGGGLSQVSTTTYNAAYLAGFEDIEHKPHSEWFARYPEGREATIFTGTLDMRWKNNSPYGALVQAWVANNRVYVRIWGTKYWSVESITSPRTGVVQPTTVYSQSPACAPSSAGNPGFAVTVTRKTSLNGKLVKTESNSWRYKPQNKIVCGPAPTPTPPAG